MHAGCQDHSPVICLHHAFASELICRNGRRVVMTVIHDFSKIETIDRRIVAADSLGVRAAFGSVPVTPVHQIVMMPEHPTCLLDSPEIGIQGLGLVGGILVHHAQCHRTCGFTAFGKPRLRLAACAEGQSQRHNQTEYFRQSHSLLAYILAENHHIIDRAYCEPVIVGPVIVRRAGLSTTREIYSYASCRDSQR